MFLKEEGASFTREAPFCFDVSRETWTMEITDKWNTVALHIFC